MTCKRSASAAIIKDIVFFYIHNLHFFEQKIYSHQVLIYIKVTEIPVGKSLKKRQIVEE